MVCYSTRKSSKWGVCSLWGSFDLQNGSDGPWGTTRCIEKVLDGRPQKFLAFLMSESGSPNKWFPIARENRQNEGYARFGARFTLKMGQTGFEGQLDAKTRSWQTTTKKFGIFYVGIRITQKMVRYIEHKNRRNEGYASFGARLTFQMGRTSCDGQLYA